MDELEAFARWYWDIARTMEVPGINSIHFMDNLTAITLYRKDQFQIELVLCSPNSEIPDHVHPNVDSFEIYMSGSIMFRNQGKLLIEKHEADAVNWNGFSARRSTCIRVRPEDQHGATIGNAGGAFLSIQQWLNGVKPTTVGHDWSGNTLGPIHAKTVK